MRAFLFGSTYEDRYTFLKSYFKEEKTKDIIDKIRKYIEQLKFSETEEIKILTDKEKGFDLSNLPEKVRSYVEEMALAYFDDMTYKQKENIILDVMKLPPHVSLYKKLGIILNRTGPVLQKIFQLIGEDSKSEKMQLVMNELKQNVRPFNFSVAKKIIEKNLERPIEEIFSHFPEKPIAAATVGQVYFATLINGKNVIVKVMRPNIRRKAREEIKTFMNHAHEKITQKFVKQIKVSIMEELDFRKESHNLDVGKKYYNYKKIQTIGKIEELSRTSKVLVMEVAPGKSLASYKNKYLYHNIVLRNKAIAHLTTRWIDQAIFHKDGFFHADLHSGNIFIDFTDTNKFLLTLIDFGAVGYMKEEEQKSIVLMAAGVLLKDEDMIFDSFHYITKINDNQRESLRSKVGDILHKKISYAEKLTEIIAESINVKISFPRNYLLFNRGRSFLEKQIISNNEIITEVGHVDSKKIDMDRLYLKAFFKYLPKSTMKILLNIHEGRSDTFKFEKASVYKALKIIGHKVRK